MRRFQALLIAAGLAAAPASAVAGPAQESAPRSSTFEKFEWSMGKGRLGVMVMSLTPELRKHFGVAEDRGVLVARVEAGTPAAAAGIAVGDVITEVRGHKVDGASDVLSALAEVNKGQTAAIQLVRDRKTLSLQATLTDDAPRNTFDSRSPGAQWLRDLMKPFTAPNQLEDPFEDWFREFRERLHPAKPDQAALRS
jgi:S1-C subfamily serine protease